MRVWYIVHASTSPDGEVHGQVRMFYSWQVKGSRWWRFYRHRLARRLGLRPPEGPKVVANSIPKAGSHLLLACLEAMPDLVYTRWHVDWHIAIATLARVLDRVQPGEFVTAHLPFSPERAELLTHRAFRMVLIVRDPRDVVVSHAHWVTYRYTRGRFHPYFRALPNDDARLMASIRGTPVLADGAQLEDIGVRFRRYLMWVEKGAHLVRFEDLVGVKGGGSREAQARTIMKLARFLEIDLSPDMAERIGSHLFNPHSPTFRRGQIGEWRRRFRAEHKAAFKEVAGDVLLALGYENHMDW